MCHRTNPRAVVSAAAAAAAMFLARGSPVQAQQAYFAAVGTFTTSLDEVRVPFTIASVGSLAFAGHSEAGGTNAAGRVVPGGGVDSGVRLFDSGGGQIASDDDGGPGNDPLLVRPTLAAGTYSVSSLMFDPFFPFGNGGWSLDVVSNRSVTFRNPTLSGGTSSLPIMDEFALGGTGGAVATFSYSAGTLAVNRFRFNDGSEALIAGGTLTTQDVEVGSETPGGVADLVFIGDGRLVVGQRLRVNKSASIGFSGTGGVDLTDGRMIIDYTGPSLIGFINAQVLFGRNNGAWNGRGISSSAAAGSMSTSLGVVEASDVLGAGGGTWETEAVDGTSVLIKYTWYGDTDLSGVVDFDDYVRIDNGFNTGLSGWFNGDLDYSSVIDFDDYVLIDLGFNTQTGTLRAAVNWLSGDDRGFDMNGTPGTRKVLEHFQQFGLPYARHFLAAVPEPATLAAVSLVASLLSRRRRRRTCPARA